MQIEILTRHFNLGDEQREEIGERLEKLERFSPRPPQSAKLTLIQERGVFTADLVLSLKNTDFRSRDEAAEPHFATESVVENVVTQLKRHKGKISGRQQGAEGGLGKAIALEAPGLLDTAGASLESEGFRLKDLNVGQALAAFGDSEHPFFVFRNVDTSQVNVVYRRPNGELGLLEEKAES